MKFHILLSSLIFLLVLVATAIGIFYLTPGSPIEYITVRGEQVEFQGSGLYRYDPAWFALEGVVWDVINLVIGLPLFGLPISQHLREVRYVARFIRKGQRNPDMDLSTIENDQTSCFPNWRGVNNENE